jgi:hypothetical protein
MKKETTKEKIPKGIYLGSKSETPVKRVKEIPAGPTCKVYRPGDPGFDELAALYADTFKYTSSIASRKKPYVTIYKPTNNLVEIIEDEAQKISKESSSSSSSEHLLDFDEGLSDVEKIFGSDEDSEYSEEDKY